MNEMKLIIGTNLKSKEQDQTIQEVSFELLDIGIDYTHRGCIQVRQHEYYQTLNTKFQIEENCIRTAGQLSEKVIYYYMALPNCCEVPQ